MKQLINKIQAVDISFLSPKNLYYKNFQKNFQLKTFWYPGDYCFTKIELFVKIFLKIFWSSQQISWELNFGYNIRNGQDMMSLNDVSVSSRGLSYSWDGSCFLILNSLVEEDKCVTDFLNKNITYPKARYEFGVLPWRVVVS